MGTNAVALGAVRRRMERSAVVTHFQMKRRLRGLALVAYVAPMVGLLGTCAGIVNAFRGCCMVDPMRCIGGGLAEGFVPLALGLAIGLPAFWAHRHLSRYADELRVEMALAADQLIEYIR